MEEGLPVAGQAGFRWAGQRIVKVLPVGSALMQMAPRPLEVAEEAALPSTYH